MERDALMRRQAELQRAAEAVDADLELSAALAALGRPVRVGSAALGLMVHEDLDVTVVCDSLDLEGVLGVGSRIARHPGVRRVVFRNDTGAWNTDPTYPDGLYLGVTYRSPEGAEWNLDVWFVDEPARQPDLEHLQTLGPRLGAEERAIIVALKAATRARPAPRLSGSEIATAVLDGGVRTLDELDAWAARPG